MLLLFILIVLAFANQEEAQNARLREANRMLLRALREGTLDTEVAVGDEESVAGCSPVCKPDEICWAEMNYCYNEAALTREISVGQFKAGSKGLRQKSVEESIGSGGICGNCDGCLRNGVCWEYSANGISGPVDGTHCTNVDGVDCTPSGSTATVSEETLGDTYLQFSAYLKDKPMKQTAVLVLATFGVFASIFHVYRGIKSKYFEAYEILV